MRNNKGNSSASTGNHPTEVPCWSAVGPQKRRRKQNHSEIRDDKKRRKLHASYPLLALTVTP